jgi:hypothetical protein
VPNANANANADRQGAYDEMLAGRKEPARRLAK